MLTPAQLALIDQPLDAHIFLEGPAGCGKTTVGVERLLHLMAQGVPGDTILLLVPQRTLAGPYYAALQDPNLLAGGMVSVVTVAGLAQRMIDLFWPVAAEAAGFAWPDQQPTFLTLETAQYYMAHLVRPLLESNYFDTITLERSRLYSQILDNLNKAALAGFPHTEIGARLKSAWVGDPVQLRVYDDVQECANRFRAYCLAHNLLDFSLQIQVFWEHLWPLPECREYLIANYRHLLVDNLEEDTAVTHDLLRDWLPYFDSAFVIYDLDAGYRTFLGAAPETGYALKELFPHQASLSDSFVTSAAMGGLGRDLSAALRFAPPPSESAGQAGLAVREPQIAYPAQTEADTAATSAGVLEFEYHRFYPAMIDWVAGQIAGLVLNEGVTPGEIVVLAPFLSDALRFALSNRLEAYGIPTRSHRPSRPLRDEPTTHCLLTLATLAYPEWGLLPTRFDVAYALVQAIQGLDLVRAQLLADIVYRVREGRPLLTSFDAIRPEVQERITYHLGTRYEQLRLWLIYAREEAEDEFDHFLSRLFGELLSQSGFGFHTNFDAGAVTANLIESVQKFRWVTGPALAEVGVPLGKEYLAMVQDGVVAAQYMRTWQTQPEDAVFLAPGYTFLLSNRPVDYQFWLEVGSRNWFERLAQPLTHPYVLSRDWPPGRQWTDTDEVAANDEALRRLALGLTRRCRRKVYLGLSEFSEQGYEERGPLLRAFQRVLRNWRDQSED